MVATRWPTFISATATCIAVVDLPEPPFSLPSTITCADIGRLASANIDATSPSVVPKPVFRLVKAKPAATSVND